MDITYTPQFQRSARLVQYLTESARIVGWIGQQMVDVSWISRTQRDALVRLAHYSTHIEGNPLTLPEVEALAAGKDLAVEERAKQEVLNYFSALRDRSGRSPPTGFYSPFYGRQWPDCSRLGILASFSAGV